MKVDERMVIGNLVNKEIKIEDNDIKKIKMNE